MAHPSSSGSSFSFGLASDEEGGDIHTIVWDLDMTNQALHEESWEVEWLWSCLLAVEMALATAKQEMAMAKAMATNTEAQFASRAIVLPLFLTLCGSTPYA